MSENRNEAVLNVVVAQSEGVRATLGFRVSDVYHLHMVRKLGWLHGRIELKGVALEEADCVGVVVLSLEFVPDGDGDFFILCDLAHDEGLDLGIGNELRDVLTRGEGVPAG